MRKSLLPEQRLEILKAMDDQRKWYSLDDKRVCAVCDRVFTGRQIDIVRDQRGRYVLKCPTLGCSSSIAHWFLCEVSAARYKAEGTMNRNEAAFLSRNAGGE